MKVGDIFIVNRQGQNREFMISLCNLFFCEEEQGWKMHLRVL